MLWVIRTLDISCLETQLSEQNQNFKNNLSAIRSKQRSPAWIKPKRWLTWFNQKNIVGESQSNENVYGWFIGRSSQSRLQEHPLQLKRVSNSNLESWAMGYCSLKHGTLCLSLMQSMITRGTSMPWFLLPIRLSKRKGGLSFNQYAKSKFWSKCWPNHDYWVHYLIGFRGIIGRHLIMRNYYHVDGKVESTHFVSITSNHHSSEKRRWVVNANFTTG